MYFFTILYSFCSLPRKTGGACGHPYFNAQLKVRFIINYENNKERQQVPGSGDPPKIYFPVLKGGPSYSMTQAKFCWVDKETFSM